LHLTRKIKSLFYFYLKRMEKQAKKYRYLQISQKKIKDPKNQTKIKTEKNLEKMIIKHKMKKKKI
jgi:hypothetical protein